MQVHLSRFSLHKYFKSPPSSAKEHVAGPWLTESRVNSIQLNHFTKVTTFQRLPCILILCFGGPRVNNCSPKE